MTCLVLGALVLGAEHAPAAAHAACTWGTPPGTSCVDALVLAGYP
ncbi:MAG: hypothetical protein JWM90_2012 [Thermoleophilia bacterium]|nr:hypothetical protein [Thermoleophilia bacterium]